MRSDSEIPEKLAPTVAAVREALAARKAGVLLVGPRGLGATLVARHVAETMPIDGAPLGHALASTEALRAAQFRAYATAGLLDYRAPRAPERPFRAPHHTVSDAGLCGVAGPYRAYSGEVALAIGGVLLLDELPEFRRAAIEALRERVGSMDTTWRPFIVATALPCPCGHFARVGSTCSCAPSSVMRYTERTMAAASLLKLVVWKTGGAS